MKAINLCDYKHWTNQKVLRILAVQLHKLGVDALPGEDWNTAYSAAYDFELDFASVASLVFVPRSGLPRLVRPAGWMAHEDEAEERAAAKKAKKAFRYEPYDAGRDE